METVDTDLTESYNNASRQTHLAPKPSKRTLEERLYLLFMTISLLFLLCHSPRFILNFYEAVSAKELNACMKAGYFGVPLWALHLAQISNVLLTINSSVNSLIYCVFSRKYREEAKKCLRCFTI